MPPLHARAHTLAVVRLLRSIGRTRRTPGRLPRQLQPDGIRRDYYAAIRPVCDRARIAFAEVEEEILRALAAHRHAMGRTDGWSRFDVTGDSPTDMVARAARRFAGAFEPRALHDVARRFGQQTSDFQRAQLDRQVRQAIGIPLAAIEPRVRDLVDLFASSNVELIKTVPTRYFDRLTRDVANAFEAGTAPETLAEQFADDYEISLNDARRIAIDQVGKLNGQVNQERQEGLGITGYTWQTTHTGRVRDNHVDLDGQDFEWSDPPMGGGTGPEDVGHLGEGINCMCSASPRLSDLLDE